MKAAFYAIVGVVAGAIAGAAGWSLASTAIGACVVCASVLAASGRPRA